MNTNKRSDVELPPELADLVTRGEAARILGVRPDAITCMIYDGRIAPAYNRGTDKAPRYRIPRAAVLACLVRVEPLVLG